MSRVKRGRRDSDESGREITKRQRRESQTTPQSSNRHHRPTRTPRCKLCTEALTKFQNQCQEKRCLCIDIPVCVLYQPASKSRQKLSKGEKRIKKDKLTERFLVKVCGLRNSKGGVLLMHIDGLSKRDRYPGTINEFTDDLLTRLIDDGTPFVDCYRKQWLNDNQNLSKFHDFLAITVSPRRRGIATASFMTKVPFDSKIEEPTACNIVKLFNSRTTFRNTETHIRGRDCTFKHLHECRNIQLKSFKPKPGETVPHNIRLLTDYIWEDLRLREYITVFSKLERGGSYFLGISETSESFGDDSYYSVILVQHGVPLGGDRRKRLGDLLLKKVKEDIFCCDYDGNTLEIVPSKLIDIAFHAVPDQPDYYVLEVAVAAVEGLVFYGSYTDTHGPKSYVLTEEADTTARVSFWNWFKLFLQKED